MTAQLRSITIKDFRSIRGELTIPLDAPIVLIHGPNGAGKTSVLSAIELALTGQVPSMARTDTSYWEHLAHKDASEAVLRIEASGTPTSTAEVRFPNGGRPADLRPLLDEHTSRFYGERCYLPQATLSRLLEIYQRTEKNSDSALTRYVKDLLGLDQLDALIAGLHPALDIRNTRNLVQDFRGTETERNEAASESERLQRSLADTRSRYADQVAESRTLAAEAGASEDLLMVLANDPVPVLDFLGSVEIADEMASLAELRIEAEALARTVSELPPQGTADLADIERRAAEADLELQEWWAADGLSLEQSLDRVRQFDPSLQSPRTSDPVATTSAATTRLLSEISRLDQRIAAEERAAAERSAVDVRITRDSERLSLLDQEVATLAPETSELVRALASMLPHIHSDECPVCRRDYGDVSTSSLASDVSSRIANLNDQSERLAELLETRSALLGSLSADERRLGEIGSERAGPDDLQAIRARVVELRDLLASLDSAAGSAERGAQLMRAVGGLQEELAARRTGNQLAVEVMASISDAWNGLEPNRAIVGSPDALAGELVAEVSGRIHQLSAREAVLRRAAESVKGLLSLRDAIEETEQRIADARVVEEQAKRALAAADRVRSVAKDLSKAASAERSATIRRVFSGSLNGVWRDLFVRLAPNEPFVPSFRIPDPSAKSLDAVLETTYRNDSRGGSPGVMLSAGNMNTAALALFMALHLSMKPELPVLVLDDPVQSMDEVHISQLAVLLRTLSREHGRQIVLAVHERPLYEYLMLELSPAFVGDGLITAELSRAVGSDSRVLFTRHRYEPEESIA